MDFLNKKNPTSCHLIVKMLYKGTNNIGKVFESLAKSIVKDGEGATKFVEIIVENKCEEDSLAIATTVAQSPLVKTALFASDPNWGRILAAIGRAPVATMNIHIVSIQVDFCLQILTLIKLKKLEDHSF